MAFSKIILNGVTQIDLTQDTVATGNLISPNTAHGADGEPVVGTASGGGGNLQPLKSVVYNPTEAPYIDRIYPDPGYDGMELVEAEIRAIPANYVGSGVPRKSSSDLTTSGATVTAPSGYYASAATATVQSGTEGTPVATKGAVNNHSVSVTPSVTNAEGYIAGGTHTGTAVSVSASELVSGTRTITSNGNSIDVANYQYADVNVPSSVLEVLAYYDESGGVWDWFLNKSFSDLADAGSQGKDIVIYTNDSVYVTADGWWDENAPLGTSYLYTIHLLTMDADNVNDLVTIEEWMYEVTSGGTTRLSYNKAYDPSLTDAVASDIRNGKKVISTTGFVTGTAPDRTSADLTVSGATVTTPAGFYASNATKTIPSGTEGTPTATKGAVSNHSVSVTPSVTNTAGYISGGTKTGTAVTVSASELVSGNLAITQNSNNIDVANYSTVSVNVSGGSSKAVYTYLDLATRRANSYGATDATVTVTKAGTYTISYMAVRGSSSGTMGTNLHIGSTAGTNNQTWTGTYAQQVTLTGQSISANTAVTVYATSGSTSRSIYVGNLIVQEE